MYSSARFDTPVKQGYSSQPAKGKNKRLFANWAAASLKELKLDQHHIQRWKKRENVREGHTKTQFLFRFWFVGLQFKSGFVLFTSRLVFVKRRSQKENRFINHG